LPGVSLGVGSVVAAGAVVTEDVSDWTVVAGVPAETIARRTDDGLESLDSDCDNCTAT
jgi:acetyltransferase-like isoleucine patch superfamily enzyme